MGGTLGGSASVSNTLTITIERNITGSAPVPGSGTVIYSLTSELSADNLDTMVSFHAVDFPPAVVVTGQICYTMFIKAASAGLTFRGPVAFSGWKQLERSMVH